MPPTVRFLVRVALVAAALAAAPAPAALGGTSPALELAQKYAPIAMLKVNDDLPCSRDGEQYRPAPVDVTLGNPSINLYREASRRGQRDAVVKSAPTAQDLAGLGPNYYLDMPGSPESPGCTYARDFQRLGQGKPAVAYAHVGQEEGVHGLVLQYWFYYYFNQFNDQHESDWEMIQLAFDADTAEDALAKGPYLVAYAQHGGGEKHGWGNPIVQKQGTHPVVFVASGSHASQFESALYLGTGESGSGLGCDDTTGPSETVPLETILVPTLPAADTSSAWLTYEGLWGQTARGFNNGITGPNMKTQWREPFRWMAGLRESTPTVPGLNSLGPSVTGFFCGAVSSVSGFITTASRTPLTALVIILAVVLAIAVPARRTRWDLPPLLPLRQRRAGGQIFRVAARLYRAHGRTLALIGLVGLPLGAVSVGFQWLVFDLTGLSAWLEDANQGWIDTLIAILVGGVGRAISYALVAAAVIAALRELDRGEPVGFKSAWRGTRERLWTLVAAQLAAAVATSVLALTVVGVPIAIWLAVRWTFVQQEILFNGKSWRDAFRASSSLVRGRWWRTAVIAAFIFLVGLAAGPVAGVVLIFLTDAPLSTINAFGSLVFALLIPYMATARTLLYFDLEAERAGLPLAPPQERSAAETARAALEHLPAEAIRRGTRIPRRNPLVQWLLTLVTGGLWGAVWTYRANRDLREFSRSVGRPVDMAAGLLAVMAAVRMLGLLPGLLAAALTAVNFRTVERWVPGARRETSAWLAALACAIFFLDVLYLQYQLNALSERIEGGGRAQGSESEDGPSQPAA